MSFDVTRRGFLKGAAIGATAIGATGWPFASSAQAKDSIVAVEWGGPYVETVKKAVEKYKKLDVTWELHTGGAAAILPKIKAAWPNVKYDVVAAWSPVYLSMMREGWADSVTVQDIPNLKDIPAGLITKDDKGNVQGIPRTVAGSFFGYRKDIAPVKIAKLNDLLDPKLKGQICWPDPLQNTNVQMVSVALGGGGNEKNMDFAWDFMKKLAKSGNIGRVANTEAEFINSMTSGETSVAYWNMGPWNAVAKNFPCEFLTKTDEPAFKAIVFTEGWCIMKSTKNRKAVCDFINFCLSPENNEWMAAAFGEAPVNSKSKAAPNVKHMVFTDAEVKKNVYIPDWAYVSEQVDGWKKRFEQEIVPLLKG